MSDLHLFFSREKKVSRSEKPKERCISLFHFPDNITEFNIEEMERAALAPHPLRRWEARGIKGGLFPHTPFLHPSYLPYFCAPAGRNLIAYTRSDLSVFIKTCIYSFFNVGVFIFGKNRRENFVYTGFEVSGKLNFNIVPLRYKFSRLNILSLFDRLFERNFQFPPLFFIKKK